ncbi:MAG: O-antigen ligase family protein [Clostridia bacterium]|nr:O-antigen ligase family protein [Clostridia bacterium]
MIENSVFLSFMLNIYLKLRDIYLHSQTHRFFVWLSDWFYRALSGSKVIAFIKRNDTLSKNSERSLFVRVLDFILNAPSRLARKILDKYENIITNSLAYKITRALLRRFEIPVALFLAVAVIVPHEKWNNLYSTLAVFALFFLFFIKTVIQRYECFDIKALDILLLCFGVVVLFATITSIFPAASLRFLLFFATCFLLVLIVVSSVKTTKSLNLLLEIFLIGVSFTGLYGVWQGKVTGIAVDTAVVDLRFNEGISGRIVSTMGNANNYAELLIMTLPFFAAVILNSPSIKKKIAFVLLALPPLASLIMTGSRSGWISFAFSVFVYIFFKNKKLILPMLILGILSIPFLPDSIYKRIMSLFNPKESSASYRKDILKTVYPMFKDYWVTGVGLGTDSFMSICGKYFSYVGKTPPHTHNLFLQVWIENGIVGIITFLWFIGRIVKQSILMIYKKIDPQINHILMAGIASLAAILLMGIGEYVWFYPRIMLSFWFIIGIILAALNILRHKSRFKEENL